MQKRTNTDAETSATVQILTQVVAARKLVEQVQEASGEGEEEEEEDDDDDDDDDKGEEEEEEEEVPKGPGDGKIMRPPPRLIAASAGQVLRVCLVSLLRPY